MKLKDFARERNMKPVDLIAALEAEIAPGCDALTDLSDEQIQSAKALLDKPAQSDAGVLDLSPIRQHLAAQLVADSRNEAIAAEVSRLVDLYESSKELPTDPSLAALVQEVSARTKKHPSQWDGETLELADQVEIIDGRVIVPIIEIPQTPTAPVALPFSPDGSLKSAVVPALSAGND
jgi:hypothetical protein